MNYENLRALLLKRFSIPKERPIKRALRSFTIAERTVFYFFVVVFILSSLVLLLKVNGAFLVDVPIRGGSLSEGVIGNPRFINPVLALSEADKNLTSLIYSGLIRMDERGGVVNDLAEGVEISENGLTYTVHIREDAVFHDGEPVMADDIVYTLQKVLDPAIKSPKRGNWEGVTVEKVDDKTVSFTLSKAYAPFIENLSLGILPKHIWKNVTDDEFAFSQFNTLPIGSGPYKVSRVERNSGGIPDYYELKPFDRAVGGAPYIGKLVFKFYPNEHDLVTAFKNGSIESVGGISPEEAQTVGSKIDSVLTSPLPRVFGVFFNQGQNKVLMEKEVRQALDLAAPKEGIVEKVLGGYGEPIDGPLPAGLFSWTGDRTYPDMTADERMQKARDILEKAGWVRDLGSGTYEKIDNKTKRVTMSLSFSISTGDVPELKAVAEELKAAWTKLGAKVEVQVYEPGDLNQNIIRPRKFDALLFGEVVGRDADVFPFWHSSERNDPGLNIALYTNSKVDKLLEQARSTNDPSARETAYKSFDQEVRNDLPAVFLYSPNYLYAVPDKVKAVKLASLATPQDRYLSIRDWYIETDRVWKIFVK